LRVIIPAGGVGLRFGGDVPKQYLNLGGEPVLKHTIAAFDGIAEEIIVAADEKYFDEIRGYGSSLTLVRGGLTRAESVFAGLAVVSAHTDVVLVHDAVRPFVSRETIEAVATAAFTHGAAVACSPVTDTIKIADETGFIRKTPNRNLLWHAQTPQGFTYENIMRAYKAAYADGTIATATDDSSLAERIGIPVRIVPSPPTNLKITNPHDFTNPVIMT